MTLPPRQAWLFQLGCWVALAVSVTHLLAHLFNPPAASAGEAALDALAAPFVFEVPGLRHPSFTSVLAGLSLAMSLLTATVGAAGLVVLKYSGDSAPLVRGVSRVFAIGTALLLAVSVVDFFSVQTFLIAVMAMCFALSAVTETGS